MRCGSSIVNVRLVCRESTTSVKVFKNFKETAALRPGFAAEGIYGGALLGIRSSDFICFYDWTTTKVRPCPISPWCICFCGRF